MKIEHIQLAQTLSRSLKIWKEALVHLETESPRTHYELKAYLTNNQNPYNLSDLSTWDQSKDSAFAALVTQAIKKKIAELETELREIGIEVE